jgi:micrococcal nuclease
LSDTSQHKLRAPSALSHAPSLVYKNRVTSPGDSMVRRQLLFLPVLLLAIANVLAGEIGKVVTVVDGDTIKVELPSDVETIRLIGIDTPETVHPQKPVEHFGREASAFTTRLALGRVVRLEDDAEGTNRDKYGRLLRYVFLPGGELLNAEIIAQGYSHAYTRFPFSRMEEFRGLERAAREGNRGLWGTPAPTTVPKAAEPDGAETVFVTRTGAKYHRAGCRSLAKSSIPISLKDATSRYGACAICGPPTMTAPSAT